VSEQLRCGTHFAQPTEDAIWIAGELSRRFGLPLWRFAKSGTEATMDAVHLARALTGRDLIIKVEGCSHGHHDSVQVSVLPDADEVGPREHPIGVPGNSGIPAALGGGIAVAAIGGSEAVMSQMADGRYEQVGTFNGNPLAMAATRATSPRC
jgi:glutamate-1-semialdehyde 2,1-aminomutase